MKKYLVFDIGGTFIKYALMTDDRTVLEQGSVASPQESLPRLLDALEEIGRRYQGDYTGVAISMPGRIDTRKGIAHTGGAFTFIKDTPFASLVEQRLQAPVVIANDGKCAANAEILDGALANVENGAVLVLGTGTGGGIVLNGKVWMGNTFAAGELSHLPMEFTALTECFSTPGFDFVNCIWVSAMSARGLLQRYAVRKGLPAEGHGIDGHAFFDAYHAKEAQALKTMEEFGRYAAIGIYAIQSVLDLERYAIGGGISARPEVTDEIRHALDALYDALPATPFSKPEIVRCHHGNNANLLGALQFLLDSQRA